MTDDRMDDAKLEELARRLGAGAAERLNVERVAGAVMERLRNEPRTERSGPSPWWMQPKWLRAAAIVVLMVGVGIVARGLQVGSRHQAHYIAEELQDLSSSQLREVLVTLDETLEAASPPSSEDDLNDLTTEQLQALLRSLEG